MTVVMLRSEGERYSYIKWHLTESCRQPEKRFAEDLNTPSSLSSILILIRVRLEKKRNPEVLQTSDKAASTLVIGKAQPACSAWSLIAETLCSAAFGLNDLFTCLIWRLALGRVAWISIYNM